MQDIQDANADISESAGREIVISMRGVRTVFGSRVIHDGVDLDVYRGEVLALVGESGAGKSVTALSVLQLLPYPPAFRDLIGREREWLRHIRDIYKILPYTTSTYSQAVAILAAFGPPASVRAQ